LQELIVPSPWHFTAAALQSMSTSKKGVLVTAIPNPTPASIPRAKTRQNPKTTLRPRFAGVELSCYKALAPTGHLGFRPKTSLAFQERKPV
jgi:hypothetical protein